MEGSWRWIYCDGHDRALSDVFGMAASFLRSPVHALAPTQKELRFWFALRYGVFVVLGVSHEKIPACTCRRARQVEESVV